MCGIAGIVDFANKNIDKNILLQMRESLAHRGPDDAGIYLADNIGLAARRLAVIDLSDAGHMPLANEKKTLWLTFNGEIYNFAELQEELTRLGHTFKSATDSEVIVHAYEEWEEDCLQKLNGMFSFALWDAKRQQLFAARDRLGVKPFHYCFQEEKLYFASEIHSLYEKFPAQESAISLTALDYFLGFAYVPPDCGFLKTNSKLPPAHALCFNRKGLKVWRYWQISLRPQKKISLSEHLTEVDACLRKAVKLRLHSDVPLGCFLSGGIDSALVTAYAAEEYGKTLRTFSVGFKGGRVEDNELPLAKLVAKKYGTQHTELIVGPEGKEILPKLLWHFGEPFADLSALPVYQISKAAKQHITVALTGDGGDESFAGYANIKATLWGEKILNLLPGKLLTIASAVARNRFMQNIVPFCKRGSYFLDHYVNKSVLDQYDLSNHWHYKLRQKMYGKIHEVREPNLASALLSTLQLQADGLSAPETHLFTDFHYRLPGDYLTKVDIASNLVSLEIRSPFLDYRLAELAAKIPLQIRMRFGRQKYLLRKLACRYLPEQLIKQPKRGFGPGPALGDWMRQDWADLIKDLVAGSLANRNKFFSSGLIKQVVDEHLEGRRNHATRLWSLLCLEIWWQLFIDKTILPGDSL